MVKRTVTVNTPGTRRRWDEDSFFLDASERLEEGQLRALRQLYDFSRQEAQDIAWGSGSATGSFTPAWSRIGGNGLFNAFSNGRLWINFGGLSEDPSLQDELKSTLEEALGIDFPDDFRGKWPTVEIVQWGPRVSEFIDAIRRLAC